MNMFKIICALSAISLVVGSVEQVQAASPFNQQEMKWEMTPVTDPLTAEQVLFLNLYANYSNYPPMSKLPRSTREILPLYVALHEAQLDPGSVVRLRVGDMLLSGMNFNDISRLRSIMDLLNRGEPLTKEENDFLIEYIKVSLRERPSLALDPLTRPLLFYVKQNPGIFNEKLKNQLRDAFFKSIGMSSADVSRLNKMIANQLESPTLSQQDIQVLRKLAMIGQLNGFDHFDAEPLLYLAGVMARNPGIFSPQEIQIVRIAVDNTPSVQKFRYENFQRSALDNPPPQRFLEDQQAPAHYLHQEQFGPQYAPQRYPGAPQAPQGAWPLPNGRR